MKIETVIKRALKKNGLSGKIYEDHYRYGVEVFENDSSIGHICWNVTCINLATGSIEMEYTYKPQTGSTLVSSSYEDIIKTIKK